MSRTASQIHDEIVTSAAMRYPTYKKYKNSTVDWLGEVPEGWEVKAARLGYSIQLGKMLQPEASSPNDQELPYLKSQHVQWESVRTTDLPTMWASSLDEAKYGVADGDLLVCEGGDVGRAGIVRNPPERSIIQNALHRVRSNNNDLRFLMFILEHAASQKWFEILCNRSTIAHFTGEKFGALRLPLPDISEQTAIAAFLDRETGRIDTLVAKKRALIDLLKEKRSGLISRTVTRGLPAEVALEFGLEPHTCFKESGVEWLGEVPEGWEVVRLGRKIILQRGIDITKDEQREGNVPVVSSGGISSFHDISVAKGPGVVVGRKGTAGAVHYIHTDYWPHDTTLWVREFFGNFPKYVYYKLSSMELESFDTGSSNPTVNRNLLHPVMVSWPPFPEQTAIATYLDRETAKIDRLVEKVEAAIDRLREYRIALITAAVTGRIDVRAASSPEDRP